jgi:hypothetical protein
VCSQEHFERATKQPRTNPPDAPNIIRSISGGATLEVVFSSSRAQSTDLRENGFAWCKVNKVWIRLLIDASITTTVADLVRIDALRGTYEGGECVLRQRAYMHPFSFSAVNQICKGESFTYRNGGWAKEMSAEEWVEMDEIAGIDSNEAVERRRVEEEEKAAQERWAAAREKKMVTGMAKWEEGVRRDPTYEARSYKYGQMLLQMQKSGNVTQGSDGGINWPAPPVPA